LFLLDYFNLDSAFSCKLLTFPANSGDTRAAGAPMRVAGALTG
jgi:hypothetical protein